MTAPIARELAPAAYDRLVRERAQPWPSEPRRDDAAPYSAGLGGLLLSRRVLGCWTVPAPGAR